MNRSVEWVPRSYGVRDIRGSMEEQYGHPCSLCQRLEVERAGAERAYALALKALEARFETASRTEYAKLRIAESDARLDLEMLRLQAERHRLEHKELRSGQSGD